VTDQAGRAVADQDPTVVDAGRRARGCRHSGFSATDPARAFVEPEHVSYPLAYERIAQLFDSPNAPDLAVNPRCYAFGRQPGQHGALDVVQARSPLIFSGPGVISGETDVICSHVDVTPTLASCGLPLIDGMDSSGRTSSEQELPDVYLKRQDGRVIDESWIPDDEDSRSVYILLLDGLSNTELKERLEHDRVDPEPGADHQAG
jgi:hypothetical protein